MKLKKFLLKIKALRLKDIFGGDGKKKRMKNESETKCRNPISHGCRIVEDPIGRTPNISDHFDSLTVRKEQIGLQQICFFGVFYSKLIADEVNKFLQSDLFDEKDKEVLARRSKGVLRKAHLNAIKMVKEKEKQSKEIWKTDVASAIVINGEKLITACMGEYRAVICRDGKASAVCNKRHHQEFNIPHCLTKNIPGFLARTKKAMVGHKSNSNNTTSVKIPSKLRVVSEEIYPFTEFVILASTGIWEVMEDQEAVNLISHMEDPQEAAECLTNEAITRTSRSSISCLVIRF